jgi:hypothetical protein
MPCVFLNTRTIRVYHKIYLPWKNPQIKLGFKRNILLFNGDALCD